MPKLKTPKALKKRIKITKRKKVIRRKCGQNHFNSKESGKKDEKKRKICAFSKLTKKMY